MRRDSFLRQVVTAVARAQPAGAPVRIETADSQTARPASQLLTAIARATPAFTPGSAPALAPRRTASQQPERAAGVPRAVSKARKADDIVEFGLQVSPARRSRSYHQALIVALAGFAVPVILAAVILIEASAKIHHPQAPIAPASSAHPTPAKTAHCTAGTGFISFANLTPAVSPIDVYLYSSGDSAPQLVDRDVAYGTVLPYHSVGACAYSVEVRTAGSSSSSRPVLTGTVTAQAGRAYTVAALAVTSGARELAVIETDLTTPAGFSLVRVIQADPGQGQVTFHCSCAAGAPGNITTDGAPGTVSPQAPIPAGTWTMTATGRTAKASIPVTLTAGTVHTFVVIATPGGGIQIVNVAESVPR